MFSSVGLIAISGLLLWQAIEQFLHPVPVQGAVAIVVGIAAAVANWGVAQLLYQPGRNNAAIRLAYIHNMGDVYVSIAPVMAGLLIITTGYGVFDPIIACGIALWIIVSTVQEVFESREQLIWPEKVVCGHSEEQERAAAS
jgi:cobalt-zinc-cadmium efflux system protein